MQADTNNNLFLFVINIIDAPVHLKAGTKIGEFTVLTAEQASYIMPLVPELLKNYTKRKQQLILNSIEMKNKYNQPPDKQINKFWFPTPETCNDPDKLVGLEKRIYNSLIEFKKAESLDPKQDEESRKQFIESFNWTESVLDEKSKKQLEDLLVDYNKIFARHRVNIGVNNDFLIKLTPEHNRPVYTQSPPTPIHLKEELLLELALLQYYGIITTLPFSKYSSPIFAQRKPSGKLRLLIDLRRINHLLRNDYHQNNFPISTLMDASSHFAGKNLFCKMDGSQGYFTLRMADQQSVQLLAFNFASRTWAFLRLAQGLSRSVSAFSSFMRETLDSVITADKCTQYVDDIATASCTVEEMIENLRAVFECLEKSGLKLSTEKCQFGVTRIVFLGKTISGEGISPIEWKIEKFLRSLKMPTNTKQTKRMIGFFQFYKEFIPELAEKLLPFYQLLRNETDFKTTDEHEEILHTLKTNLKHACQLSLRLPRQNDQYVIMADASFYAAGYVLMIKDYCQIENQFQYAPVCFGSRIFPPSFLKLSIYAKEFAAVHYALDTFGHIVWGATQPILILTDNRALTRFFQAKTIPSPLWTAVDHVLSFNFILGHVPGKTNLAADYLSWIHINPEEKMQLRIAEKLPVHKIDVDVLSKTPDNSFLSLTSSSNPDIKSKYQNLEGRSWGGMYDVEPIQVNSVVMENPVDDFDLSDRCIPVDLANEQQQDSNIRVVFQWIQTNQYPTDRSYLSFDLTKYLKQSPRLTIQQGVLYRKFFDQTGRVALLQYCVPQQLRAEVLYRVHNSPYRGHLGISITIKEFRRRFYFPGFSEVITDYIKNCLTCLQHKPAPTSALRPPLQPISATQIFPEDMLQIDLVGKLPGKIYCYILTAIDVFSKYMFAVPLRKADAYSVCKALVSIILKHSYIPTMLVTDLGTAFTSQLLRELCKTLQIELKHATIKHAQTIGLLERNHAPLKQFLKMHRNSYGENWHNHLDLAIFVHNTTYNASIGCTPSDLFHGRPPNTPLDLLFHNRQFRTYKPSFESLRQLQDATLEQFAKVKENLMSTYNRYRQYYDRKAGAAPLELHDYCLMLDPTAIHQSSIMHKNKVKWKALYRVEQVLTNSNYIVRQTGTHKTYCCHRIRLRPIKPNFVVPDIETVNPLLFEPAEVNDEDNEPEIFDTQLERHIARVLVRAQSENDAPRHVRINENSNELVHYNTSDPATLLRPSQNIVELNDDVFVVEGQTNTETSHTSPESIDTANILSPQNTDLTEVPANTLSNNARLGSDRNYNLRSRERFELARQYSPYNLLQLIEDDDAQPEVSVTTILPNHQPELTITMGPHSDDDELITESLKPSVSQIGDNATTEGYITDEELSNSADPFSDSEWPAAPGEFNTVPTRDQQSVSTTSSDENHRTASQEANHHDIQVFEPPPGVVGTSTHKSIVPLTRFPLKQDKKRYVVPLELNRQILDGKLHQEFSFNKKK